MLTPPVSFSAFSSPLSPVPSPLSPSRRHRERHADQDQRGADSANGCRTQRACHDCEHRAGLSGVEPHAIAEQAGNAEERDERPRQLAQRDSLTR